ncbi:hypothetical protein DSECCO2_158910 [anaerobic digester metagenome]
MLKSKLKEIHGNCKITRMKLELKKFFCRKISKVMLTKNACEQQRKFWIFCGIINKRYFVTMEFFYYVVRMVLILVNDSNLR